MFGVKVWSAQKTFVGVRERSPHADKCFLLFWCFALTGFVATKTAGNCSDVSLKKISGLTCLKPSLAGQPSVTSSSDKKVGSYTSSVVKKYEKIIIMNEDGLWMQAVRRLTVEPGFPLMATIKGFHPKGFLCSVTWGILPKIIPKWNKTWIFMTACRTSCELNGRTDNPAARF